MITTTITDGVLNACKSAYNENCNVPCLHYGILAAILEYDKSVCEPLREERDAAFKRMQDLGKDVDRYQRINNCGGNALHSTTLISELKAQIERAIEILKAYRATGQSGALMASMIEHDLECAREAYETNNVDGIIYWEKILSELKK